MSFSRKNQLFEIFQYLLNHKIPELFQDLVGMDGSVPVHNLVHRGNPEHAQKCSRYSMARTIGHSDEYPVILPGGPVVIPTHNIPGFEEHEMFQFVSEELQGWQDGGLDPLGIFDAVSDMLSRTVGFRPYLTPAKEPGLLRVGAFLIGALICYDDAVPGPAEKLRRKKRRKAPLA